jgi:hypothetical protein
LQGQSINNLIFLAMKNFKTLFLIALALIVTAPSSVNAQEEESLASIDGGLDLYSSYIWRGAKFGSGPAFQPWVEGSVGGLAIGAWGSVNASVDESMEMDLYLGYSFDFGLSLAITDYYFGGDWIDFSGNHYIEPMASFELGNFTLTGAYMLLPDADAIEAVNSVPASVDLGTGIITPAIEGIEGADAVDFGSEGDIYLELGYSFESVDIALGAGNGQYVSEDDDFMICNITVGTSKEIAITESFSLPLSAAVTLNPSTGGFFIYAGISF